MDSPIAAVHARTVSPALFQASRLVELGGRQTTDDADHGGNKIAAIRKHPLLIWYHELFEAYLSESDSRLMVIGYGFRDPHINRMIVRAAGKNPSMLLFLVDPRGRSILPKQIAAIDDAGTSRPAGAAPSPRGPRHRPVTCGSRGDRHHWPRPRPLPRVNLARSAIRSSRSARSNSSCWASGIGVCRANCLTFSAISR